MHAFASSSHSDVSRNSVLRYIVTAASIRSSKIRSNRVDTSSSIFGKLILKKYEFIQIRLCVLDFVSKQYFMRRDKYKGIRSNSSIKQCILCHTTELCKSSSVDNRDMNHELEEWDIYQMNYKWYKNNKTCTFCTKCLSHRCKGDGAFVTYNNKSLSKQKGELKKKSKSQELCFL